MKVENFEDTSLHVSAMKMEWQFIINFAPFSSTIAEKCLREGKNALGLVLDINTSDLEHTEKILHQKASESLTFNAKSAPDEKVQDFACQFDKEA